MCILQDTSILESFSRNLEGATHLEKITLSSNKNIENNTGIYKIRVRFIENTKSALDTSIPLRTWDILYN